VARLYTNWAGFVLQLNNQETIDVVGAADPAVAVGAFVAAVPGPQTLVIGVIVAYIGAQRALITAVNRGNGVYLTVPWTAVAVGGWWLVIPTPVDGNVSAWGDAAGDLVSQDDDLITYTIDANAVPAGEVEFVLDSAGEKDKKELILDDGMGGVWTVYTDGARTQDRNGLYLNQLPNGKLTFKKWKFFRRMADVMELPIASLTGGDRVNFSWQRD